jgi:DnaJ-class molecular chaperone
MKGQQSVSHESRIVHCSGPHDPHALHGISTIPRSGDLDVRCTGCAGHGQWNREIDLVSQRSKRHICDACDGRGWIETGDDPVSSHDIEMSADGYPKWVTRLDPPDTIV